MNETAKSNVEGWMILELFGHNVIAGYMTQESIEGAAFVRLDVPEVDGQPAFTKFYNGAAIYAMTPTDEATAAKAASKLAVRPVQPWVVPDTRHQLPAPTIENHPSNCACPDCLNAAEDEEERYPKRLRPLTWNPEINGYDLPDEEEDEEGELESDEKRGPYEHEDELGLPLQELDETEIPF